jgi:uncharacterized cupin superfamily protein
MERAKAMSESHAKACVAADAAGRSTTNYPPAFAERVKGRFKRPLGDLFGIASFGVNLTTLEPGAQSSIKHRHTVQDEFVYVIEGELVLAHDEGVTLLSAGMCAGFPHGGSAHHLLNRSSKPATYLEVGDRQPGDSADFPDDDLIAVRSGQEWCFTHKDGTSY